MSNKADYPEYFAKFYDVVYDKIRTGVDDSFFIKKILEAKGPVLEVGTGTGRFFIEALKRGADIYGIDISKSMIDRLKQKIDKNFHYRVSIVDVCEMSLNRKFELIIAPFRVFSHLIEVEDQLKALDAIYEHLNDNGMFIFDLYVPNPKMITEGLDDFIDFDGEYEKGKRLRRIVSMKADIVNQISNVAFKLVFDEDEKERTEEWLLKMRFYFRFELEHLIHLSKLKLVTIYGDYSENPLNKDSQDFIVVCRK